MERYSKRYPSKWQSQYSEEFKRHVCQDFMTGTLTRRQVEHKHKIGNTRLTYWLKELGYRQVPQTAIPLYMNKQCGLPSAEVNDVAKLKRELEDARLLAEAYRLTIEIAERELKIEIQKKSATK
jgi:transposase-like protein